MVTQEIDIGGWKGVVKWRPVGYRQRTRAMAQAMTKAGVKELKIGKDGEPGEDQGVQAVDLASMDAMLNLFDAMAESIESLELTHEQYGTAKSFDELDQKPGCDAPMNAMLKFYQSGFQAGEG